MAARRIGVVAYSGEGAALCYRTICVKGTAILGPHAHGRPMHPPQPKPAQQSDKWDPCG